LLDELDGRGAAYSAACASNNSNFAHEPSSIRC
jgi:hypothetical protein